MTEERASTLGTPEQQDAERMTLAILRDADVLAVQDEVRTELAATPRGSRLSGAIRLDTVIRQWTASLTMDELSYLRRADPAFTQGTDTTPRNWLGHFYPGHCKAGDNPDMIGRSSVIDGTGCYEVTGRIDPARPPAQLVCSIFAGTMTHPAPLNTAPTGKPNPDDGIFRLIAAMTEQDLQIGPDGTFRLTIGGDPEPGVPHLKSEATACSFGFRAMIVDWTTPPVDVRIRRLDPFTAAPVSLEELKQAVLQDLRGYLQFWGHYSAGWMGGIEAGQLIEPVPREGGWGYLAASYLQLEPGQCAIATMRSGGASYHAMQFTDPWMIAPPAGLYQSSLNCVQAAPDADGATTFVLSPVDPGVANWVDMCGLTEGFATMRWQGFPEPRESGDGLLDRFEVIDLADLESIEGLTRMTPQQRSEQLAQRRADFATRYSQ